MRYEIVAREAGLSFPESRHATFRTVERLPGSASHTDFGAPGEIAAGDREPLMNEEAARQAALVKAC